MTEERKINVSRSIIKKKYRKQWEQVIRQCTTCFYRQNGYLCECTELCLNENGDLSKWKPATINHRRMRIIHD